MPKCCTSLLVDGGDCRNLSGVLVVPLPQILILFLFILAQGTPGYLPRAAFLLRPPHGWPR